MICAICELLGIPYYVVLSLHATWRQAEPRDALDAAIRMRRAVAEAQQQPSASTVSALYAKCPFYFVLYMQSVLIMSCCRWTWKATAYTAVTCSSSMASSLGALLMPTLRISLQVDLSCV